VAIHTSGMTSDYTQVFTVAADAARWLLATFTIAMLAVFAVIAIRIKQESAMNRRFNGAFLAAPDLESAARIDERGGCARIAAVGFGVLHFEREWNRHELLKRNLERQARRERRRLENGLGLLAGAGSAAGYVGLCGTICGFLAGTVNEALVVTAVGTVIVIPAWLVFTFLELRLKSLAADLDDFVIDFLNLVDRAPPQPERKRARGIFRPQLVIGDRKPP
jgi:biopolymer transport protein ExbB